MTRLGTPTIIAGHYGNKIRANVRLALLKLNVAKLPSPETFVNAAKVDQKCAPLPWIYKKKSAEAVVHWVRNPNVLFYCTKAVYISTAQIYWLVTYEWRWRWRLYLSDWRYQTINRQWSSCKLTSVWWMCCVIAAAAATGRIINVHHKRG